LKSIITFFTLIFLFTGCGTPTPSKESFAQNNHKPSINVGDKSKDIVISSKIRISKDTNSVKPNEIIELSTDSNPNIIEYQWWDENGNLLGTTPTTSWEAPNDAGTYNITLTVIDTNHKSIYTSVNITVEAPEVKPNQPTPVNPVNNGSFSAIQQLISYANQGRISNATYICVGDSTRAESKYQGQYLFYALRDSLRQYNVKSYLLAKAGHEIKRFVDESDTPTWRDTVALIPGNGQNTIVDICLGINDYWNMSPSSIKPNIRTAIAKIRARKPQTHFILTMPDRIYNNEVMTNDLRRIYIELSRELHLPLNNVIDDVMPQQSSTPYSWYRNDGFNVHLSREGQRIVSQLILGNMLP
jgi:lysophospholipase L1-like esterase